jgi:hypothetical protein
MKSIRVKIFLGGILTCLLLIGCGAPSQTIIPTQPQMELPSPTSILPTATPQPAATFTPEPTPTIVPTATPESQIFRDDFNGELQPGWIWENENPDRWMITDDGWLQILAEDDSILGGGLQSNLLFRDLPEGNFAVTTHLIAAPDSNFQQAAIFLYEDIHSYVAINRGYCEPCFPGKGNGIFVDYKVNDHTRWSAELNTQIDQTDVYLRLVSKDKIIYAYYALVPDEWQFIIRLGEFFEFTKVGLGVSNIDNAGIDSDLVGSYDYFEITRP